MSFERGADFPILQCGRRYTVACANEIFLTMADAGNIFSYSYQ